MSSRPIRCSFIPGRGESNLKNVFCEDILRIKFTSIICEFAFRWTPLIISQFLTRQWLWAVRPQGIYNTWAKVDWVLCRYMAYLQDNEFNIKIHRGWLVYKCVVFVVFLFRPFNGRISFQTTITRATTTPGGVYPYMLPVCRKIGHYGWCCYFNCRFMLLPNFI